MATTTVMLTARTGAATINVPNNQTNGTGAMVPLLTGSGTYGSTITSITIKAVGATTQGMVRLFIDVSGTKYLFEEFSITPTNLNQNYGVLETFSSTLTFPMDSFKLSPGATLFASTQNAEQFNVIVDGYDISYCPC